MNVLVIGGGGYVGSVLCPMLAKNTEIKHLGILDTFWFWDSIQDYRNIFEQGGLIPEIYQEDIRDVYHKDFFIHYDVVINLACISNDISSDLDPKFTHDVSYNGVMNVIKSCERAHIKRIIHLSSGSVYGVQEEPVSEDTYPEPITQYAVLKREIDNYLQYLMKKTDSNITIIRPATLYGKSPRQRLDLMLNIFADKVSSGDKIVVHGGSQSRPALHVKDLSIAIEKIITNKNSYGEIYNASKEAMTVAEYAKIFHDKYGTEIIFEDVNDARSWRTNSEKMYRELGIIHETSLNQGIKDLVKSFSNGIPNREKSVNIKVMKELLCR